MELNQCNSGISCSGRLTRSKRILNLTQVPTWMEHSEQGGSPLPLLQTVILYTNKQTFNCCNISTVSNGLVVDRFVSESVQTEPN